MNGLRWKRLLPRVGAHQTGDRPATVIRRLAALLGAIWRHCGGVTFCLRVTGPFNSRLGRSRRFYARSETVHVCDQITSDTRLSERSWVGCEI